MLLVFISPIVTGPLVRLHCKVNATLYKEILKNHVVPNLRTAIIQSDVFMQDNAVKYVKAFLSDEDITVMELPTQSPDMNPIENVRNY